MPNDAQAARYAHLACYLYRKCDGLRAPLGAQVDAPLTTIQEEIALLAAAELSSRDIATRVHLSVRTIDNHLRTVYGIFDIPGRGAPSEFFPVVG